MAQMNHRITRETPARETLKRSDKKVSFWQISHLTGRGRKRKHAPLVLELARCEVRGGLPQEHIRLTPKPLKSTLSNAPSRAV